MNIKIECPCGLHYEFEVAPVNGRMPLPVSCPDCGADGTALADAIIRRQLAASAPKRVPNPYVRLAFVAAAVVALGLWGFYRFYLSQPRLVYSQKIPRDQQRIAYRMISPTEIFFANAKQVGLFDLKKGSQRWTADFKAAASGSDDSELDGDKAKDKIPGEPDTPAQVPRSDFESDEDEFFSVGAKVQAGATGVWLISHGRLAHFDRQTGQRQADIKIPQPILHLRNDANSLMAISAPDETRRVVTRVSFANGDVETEEVNFDSPTPAKKGRWRKAIETAIGTPAADSAPTDDSQDELLLAQPTVVQMRVKLLEEKIVTYEAMAPKKGPTMVESGNLTSGQSVAAALEEVNELQRRATGGTAEEDQSRYQVTLRRWLAKDAPDWTGEIIGPPAFHPLKTVDVVAGVRSITVFDKANKKLWEGKLGYPLSRGLSFGFNFDASEKNAPFVEHGDDLYVADAGVLARFNLRTGEVKWRLHSVGISKVLFDDTGQIYLTSTTASPDSIQHWQEVNIRDQPKPVILKVDAATGKPLWQVESSGDTIALSGKYLYATRTSMDKFAGLNSRDAPEMHFNLYRIDPSSGETLWHHYENRAPLRVDFEGREIMLHFKDELQVLKYFSL